MVDKADWTVTRGSGGGHFFKQQLSKVKCLQRLSRQSWVCFWCSQCIGIMQNGVLFPKRKKRMSERMKRGELGWVVKHWRRRT